MTELMFIGTQMLGTRHVLDDVSHLLHDVQVEGTFLDGTKLVTVHHPICTQDGDLNLALHGSFLPMPNLNLFPLAKQNIKVAGK